MERERERRRKSEKALLFYKIVLLTMCIYFAMLGTYGLSIYVLPSTINLICLSLELLLWIIVIILLGTVFIIICMSFYIHQLVY